MDSTEHLHTYRDLMFFGKVNAGISHELKNILAIISETSGLMTDLLTLAAKDKKVEPETLLACGRDIVEEIQRGFSTIKQMNVFSHSVDKMVREIHLHEMLELVIGITGFLSFTGNVDLERMSDDDYQVVTSPFRLQQVIYETLVIIFRSIGPRGKIRIKTIPVDHDRFHMMFFDIEPQIADVLSLDSVDQIARSVNAGLSMDADGQTFILDIPRCIDASEILP